MKFFKILASIALVGIAVSTAGLAYQSLNNSNKDNSDKVVDNTNNNDNNNNSGNTTNVSAYSNLVVQEQAPEDTNSIWIKSDLNVKNVEYTGNSNLNYTNNFSFEKKADLYNDSNFTSERSYKQKIYNGSIYTAVYDSTNKNIYVNVYDGNSLNKINIDTVLGSNSCCLYIDTYNNYLYVLNLYNNHFYLYKYDFSNNNITTYDIYNSNLTIGNYNYNFIVFNNSIYLFSDFNDYYDYKGNLSTCSFELMEDTSIIYQYSSSSYSQDNFNVIFENENEIRFINNYYNKNYLYYYVIDKSTESINKIDAYNNFTFSDTRNTGYIEGFTIIHDGYYYKYSYINNTYYENGSSKYNYVIKESIYDINTFELFSVIYYDISDLDSSTFGLSNYNYRIVNNQIEIDLYCNYNPNTGIYKLTKGLVKNEPNKLLIVDSEANKSNNLNPYIIKFNNLFSYKLYTPRFYITDNEGYSKQVYAYKYNTSTQAWESI